MDSTLLPDTLALHADTSVEPARGCGQTAHAAGVVPCATTRLERNVVIARADEIGLWITAAALTPCARVKCLCDECTSAVMSKPASMRVVISC